MTGVHWTVSSNSNKVSNCACQLSPENLVSYRVQCLSDLLVNALKYGANGVYPELEPLKAGCISTIVEYLFTNFRISTTVKP